MAKVVLAEPAVTDLDRLIETHSLPATTRARVRASVEPLAWFPMMGSKLGGKWQGFRYLLGPWPWMLIVYEYDETEDRVEVTTIEDSRSSRAATSER